MTQPTQTAQVTNTVATDGFQTGLTDSTTTAPQPQTLPAPNASEITVTTTPAPDARFTADDLARARQQEKDKLYDEIADLKTIVNSLKSGKDAEVEAARKAAEDAANQAAEEARLRAERETDVRSLLAQKEQEWAAKLDEERNAREMAIATFEQERRLSEFTAYRDAAVAAASDDIVPDLIDLVTGSTPEEIDASIAGLKERSTRILESAAAAVAAQRQQMQGTSVTGAPASGPLDTTSGQQQLTAEAIKNMSVDEYAQVRHKIIGQSSGLGVGIFGPIGR